MHWLQQLRFLLEQLGLALVCFVNRPVVRTPPPTHTRVCLLQDESAGSTQPFLDTFHQRPSPGTNLTRSFATARRCLVVVVRGTTTSAGSLSRVCVPQVLRWKKYTGNTTLSSVGTSFSSKAICKASSSVRACVCVGACLRFCVCLCLSVSGCVCFWLCPSLLLLPPHTCTPSVCSLRCMRAGRYKRTSVSYGLSDTVLSWDSISFHSFPLYTSPMANRLA